MYMPRSSENLERERLNTCFERYKEEDRKNGGAGKVSQAELARRINERYENDISFSKVSQVSISRWLKIDDESGRGASFPPMGTIIMLADFFGVDVGYLLGETSSRTFEMQDAVDYLGLDEATIERIRLYTQIETAFRETGMKPFETSEIIGSLLGSRGFRDLLNAFQEMKAVYSGPDTKSKLLEELEEKYGVALLARALETNPYEEGENSNPKLIEAYKDIQSAIDAMREADLMKELYTDAAKHKLSRCFSQIIDELYPQ